MQCLSSCLIGVTAVSSLCVYLTVCERLFLSCEYEYRCESVLMIFMIHGMKWEGISLYYYM